MLPLGQGLPGVGVPLQTRWEMLIVGVGVYPHLGQTLFPVYVATLLWAGLWLRDQRVRALLATSEEDR